MPCYGLHILISEHLYMLFSLFAIVSTLFGLGEIYPSIGTQLGPHSAVPAPSP